VTDLVWYFLKLGSIGFGGPAALVGYMRRDLVDERKLVDEATYNLSIALAQIMPGPLGAQTAMAIGYFQGGVIGASLVGLAFILPSFMMVLGLSIAYEPRTPAIDLVLPPNTTRVLRLRTTGETRVWYWSVHELRVWTR